MRRESPQKLHHRASGRWQPGEHLLDDAIAAGPADLQGIFGNARPVELEIGSGKGTFLLARGKARPELNVLGVEWAGSYAAYCADRFRRHGLDNVRMLHADATDFVTHCLPDACLLRVHVYFPDPWPKRKHHRRRSIQLPFVDQLWRVLMPGGQLLIVTDHQAYFQHIRRVLAQARGWCLTNFPTMHDADGQIVGTNFERKYIAQGRPFYQAARMKYV